MSVYLVTWDLNQAGANYTKRREDLVSYLNKFDNIRDEDLDSAWFVSANLTANQLTEGIRVHTTGKDSFVVTRLVSGYYNGALHQDVWAWIRARL